MHLPVALPRGSQLARHRLSLDYKMTQEVEQQLLPPPLLFCRWSKTEHQIFNALSFIKLYIYKHYYWVQCNIGHWLIILPCQVVKSDNVSTKSQLWLLKTAVIIVLVYR